MRLSRWRPVCPECGYSLRGSSSARCPECGVPFPSTNRFFRRWACRRLAWDRQHRGGVVQAYVRTLVSLTCMPWRTGTGLTISDHGGRTLRWGLAHVAAAMTIGAALGTQKLFLYWAESQFTDPVSVWAHPSSSAPAEPPAGKVLTWFAESCLAWVVAAGAVVMVGVCLSFLLPRRHRAAKRGGVKVSLYLSLLLPLAIGLWYAYKFVHPDTTWMGFPFPQTSTFRLPAQAPRVTLIGYWYGLWWAIAMAYNPYERLRGAKGVIIYGALFAVVWFLVTHTFFPARELVVLL